MNNEVLTLICFGLAFAVGMLPMIFGDRRGHDEWEDEEYYE